MLHLNVPGREDSKMTILLWKTKWFPLSMLAPELVMLFAGGQWASAYRSVRDMSELGISEWSLVHAFHADSGGFELHTEYFVPFPVNA